ncbi:MAG: hypothetical protein ACFFE2_09590 [Candidatus Thorarchaeota archaeon]
MAQRIVTYKPLATVFALIVIGTFLFLVAGYYVADFFLPTETWNWANILLFFIGLPVLVAALGFYIGWYGKRNAVEYTDPTWTVAPVQMTIDDAEALVKRHRRRYWRLVSNSNYWTFFIPIGLLLFMAALPVYLVIEQPTLNGLDYWMFAVSLALVYAVASIGSLLATSNDASEDFNMLLVREAITLAKAQEQIPGLSQVRVVFDKGEIDSYEMYESPRVVSRIVGIEKDAYIESWAEDLHAVNRVLCRLRESDGTPQVVWWWVSTDRNFRKFVGTDEKGYYVQLPVKSKVKRLGVKDIVAVFQNAVAITILEWLRIHGEKEELFEILMQLNAVPPEG